MNALVERLRARTDLLPLKARGLKRFVVELNAISEVGLPWKAVWRILRDVGYQGTYRQFVAMANRLTGKPSRTRVKTKILPAKTAERQSQPAAAPVANQGFGKIPNPNGRSEEKRKWLDWIASRRRTGPGTRGSIARSSSNPRRSRADVRNDRTIERQGKQYCSRCKCPDEVRDGTPKYPHDARTVCRS